MGDIISLNRVRKKRERDARRKPGARHVKAGLSKTERSDLAHGNERADSDLDGKKLEAEPEPPRSPDER